MKNEKYQLAINQIPKSQFSYLKLQILKATANHQPPTNNQPPIANRVHPNCPERNYYLIIIFLDFFKKGSDYCGIAFMVSAHPKGIGP